MLHITGGKVTYGRTIKTGDYENKRADVEINFSVPDEDEVSYEDIMTLAADLAHKQCHRILGLNKMELPPPMPKVAKAPTPAPKPVEVIEEAQPEPPVEAKRKAGRPPKAKLTPATAAPVEDVMIDEQLPFDSDPEPDPLSMDDFSAVAEVTDADLQDAVTVHNNKVKNPTGIKRLVGVYTGPGGKLFAIPQESRGEFLAKLKDIPPLA